MNMIEIFDKQQRIFRRRTRVLELRYLHHYRKNKIASILGVNKSTITRDVEFLTAESKEFLDKLEIYQKDINKIVDSIEFKRTILYDQQEEMRMWLESSQAVLEHYKEMSDLGLPLSLF